ncbi:hypothetical protein KI387_001009, partial [Taxus chinensis]
MFQKWAAMLGVIIVSVNYRLAPEHRLPATYHDVIDALHWIGSMKTESDEDGRVEAEVEVDPWFDSHDDFSKDFVAGGSAGGNIVHHVGVWAASGGNVEIQEKGMILMYPYFGGEDWTPSESLKSPEFNLEQSDVMSRLTLPPG